MQKRSRNSAIHSSCAIAGLLAAVISARAQEPSNVAADAAGVFDAPAAAKVHAVIGAVDPSAPIHVMMMLVLRDPFGAEAFVKDVSDPASHSYGKYLTPGEFGHRFGMDPQDHAKLIEWLRTNGFTVSKASSARTALSVRGSAATFERVFSTRLASFKTEAGKIGVATTVAPSLPAELVGRVAGIIGLRNDRQVPTLARMADPKLVRTGKANATGVLGGFGPKDLRGIYDVPKPLTTKAPQTIALFEQGGFNPTDVVIYKQQYKLPDVPVIAKGVDGSGTGETPAVDLEAALDIDMSIAINPNLAKVLVYEDADDTFPVAVIDSLSSIAEDNIAKVVSISYGFDEAFVGPASENAVKTMAIQLAAQGQTIFVSTGDSGAYGDEPPNYNTSFPATNPYVTAVGGTTVLPSNGGYGVELAWNELIYNYGATGGGVSAFFKIPDWQVAEMKLIGVRNGGSATMRNVPDVAAVGDPLTGVSVYCDNSGGWGVIGGTSVSAPVWAGFASLMNSALVGAGLPPLGFFNPRYYKIDLDSASGTNDVQEGSNGEPRQYTLPGYSAGFLYDNTSGLGSILVNQFILTLMSTNYAATGNPGIPGGITITPNSTSAEIVWSPATKASGYYVFVVPGFSSEPVSAVTTSNRITLRGLTPSSTYTAYVYAENIKGQNSSSPVIFNTIN